MQVGVFTLQIHTQNSQFLGIKWYGFGRIIRDSHFKGNRSHFLEEYTIKDLEQSILVINGFTQPSAQYNAIFFPTHDIELKVIR